MGLQFSQVFEKRVDCGQAVVVFATLNIATPAR
jgi:hypothetical protein